MQKSGLKDQGGSACAQACSNDVAEVGLQGSAPVSPKPLLCLAVETSSGALFQIVLGHVVQLTKQLLQAGRSKMGFHPRNLIIGGDEACMFRAFSSAAASE